MLDGDLDDFIAQVWRRVLVTSASGSGRLNHCVGQWPVKADEISQHGALQRCGGLRSP